MKILKSYSEKEIKKINKIVKEINKLDSTMQNLSDMELKNKTAEFKKRLKEGQTLDDILIEAFSVVREASSRILGLKHYHEQIIGGIILHQGRVAEMKTGEGKTLVATLPAYLNALTEKGVHVITVNDYLAQRDKEYAEKVYEFLGITSGVIVNGLSEDARKHAYNADITYGTNNEFAFDYLRDNMALDKNQKVHRILNFAIIDEVDSILIDEARTPLIISGKGNKEKDLYKLANFFAKILLRNIDYTIDEKSKAAMLTNSGIEKAETYFKIDNYSDIKNISIQHYVIQALKANYIMKINIDYMINEKGEILIIDEFTGRAMHGRRYSNGLHQAIEAKENVKIKEESQTLASITFQNYFRMYKKLSGMTGTGLTEDSEFREIYQLDVIEIPTHRPVIRKDRNDIIFKTHEGKIKAIVKDISNTNKKGQPILIGTASIEKSEELSRHLTNIGLPHQVLNAKFHDKEAEIIARAGEKGMITIATNMAGRGTDIKLGKGVKEIGGLKVIGTERNDARRIDNQLRGRSGRQGDPGESVFYLSLDDDLMRVFGPEKLQLISKTLSDDKPLDNKFVSNSIEKTQKNVEGDNFKSRKNILHYDDVVNVQRKIIYEQRDVVLNNVSVKEQIMSMIEYTLNYIIDNNENIEDINKKSNRVFNVKHDTCESSMDIVNDNASNKKKYDTYISYVLKRYENIEQVLGLNSEKVSNLRAIERIIMLKVVDECWMNHLDDMEHLKEAVALRVYKQQDPIQCYQLEGSELFNQMVHDIKYNTIRYLFNLK